MFKLVSVSLVVWPFASPAIAFEVLYREVTCLIFSVEYVIYLNYVSSLFL